MFTRMILDDPALEGAAAVLFDEFHERSLDADLGLALARDAQGVLRDDLRLLVMSATLDGARVSALLGDAPVVESLGRAHPVETRYLGRDPTARLEPQVVRAVLRALAEEEGGVLVFLPGRGRDRPGAPPARRTPCPGARGSRSTRFPAPCRRKSRTAPSPPRRPACARWCWLPPSPRPA